MTSHAIAGSALKQSGSVNRVIKPSARFVTPTSRILVSGPVAGPSRLPVNTPPCRSISTSTPRSSVLGDFFSSRTQPRFTARSSKSPEREDFQHATEIRDFQALTRAYDSLLPLASEKPPPLSSGDLYVAMRALSDDRNLFSINILRRIYNDLTPRWNIPRIGKHHRIVLQGLARRGMWDDVVEFLRVSDLDKDKEMWRDTLWMAIHQDPAAVDFIWENLELSIKPGALEYAALLTHLRLNIPDKEAAANQLAQILTNIKSNGEVLHGEGKAQLVRLQLKLGDLKRAEEVVASWDLGKTKNQDIWNAVLDVEMYKAGDTGSLSGVEEVLEGMRSKKLQIPERAFTYLAKRIISRLQEKERILLDSDRIIRIVEELEETTDTKAGTGVWSNIIYQILSRIPSGSISVEGQSSPVDVGLAIYNEAKYRGLPVTSLLAKSMITALVQSQPPDLLRAMAVFSDWTSTDIPLTWYNDRVLALSVYTILLSACSRHPNGLPTAIHVLNDLRSRSLPIPAKAATTLLVAIMRVSEDHSQAFNLYAHFHALNSGNLSSSDYESILTAFLKLSTSKTPFAPPHLYLEILKDMKRSGHPPSSKILTSLLHSYGLQANKSRKTSSDPEYRAEKIYNLQKAITEVHTFIKLDPLVNVDIPFLTALMDAYSRTGYYGKTFEVWDEIVERRAREDQSKTKELYGPPISVILDAAGRSDQYSRAKRIWVWSKRVKLRNERHWEAWVECLARLGQFQEAIDVVCGDMKTGNEGAPIVGKEVDVDILRVLLKLSWRSRESYRLVQERIREAYPEVWNQVKDTVETASIRNRSEQGEAE